MEVYLLGQFQVKVGSELITGINHASLRELLAYLILHIEYPISKQLLAGLFWPDVEETQSHTNLRQFIFRLRQAWAVVDQELINNSDSLQWNAAVPFWCDVFEGNEMKLLFRELLRNLHLISNANPTA